MSSFFCPHCGKSIIDTPNGYVTGCEHYPLETKNKSVKDCKHYEKSAIGKPRAINTECGFNGLSCFDEANKDCGFKNKINNQISDIGKMVEECEFYNDHDCSEAECMLYVDERGLSTKLCKNNPNCKTKQLLKSQHNLKVAREAITSALSFIGYQDITPEYIENVLSVEMLENAQYVLVQALAQLTKDSE